jgi:hypothetical protein
MALFFKGFVAALQAAVVNEAETTANVEENKSDEQARVSQIKSETFRIG